jgi:endo-1,3(4)-beta-glucanase
VNGYRLKRIGGISLITILLLAGIIYIVFRPAIQKSINGDNHENNSLVDNLTLNALEHKSGSSASTTHVGSGLIPPTNSWISGAVLQDVPKAVYPMPISFLAKKDGFEVGLPTVTSTPTTIAGPHTQGIGATIGDAADFKLSRFDKVSATLSYLDTSGANVGDITIAEGSPFVFFRASKMTTITVSGTTDVSNSSDSSYLRFSRDGHSYVATTTSGATIKNGGGTAIISTPAGSLVTFYSLPSASTKDTLRAVAANSLTHVTTSHANNNGMITTSLFYETSNHKQTAVVPMTYESSVGSVSPVLTYDSIYGPMPALIDSKLTTQAAAVTPKNQLNVSHLSASHKAELIAKLKMDSAAAKVTATDSYFAGKQLARTANLLDLAEQLKQMDEISHLRAILTAAFSDRLASSYWYYDTTLHGVAAQNKAFGSEDFNDHHFHYGYFLYAASILGKYDAGFLKQHSKQVDLLAADIASYTATSDFPLRRNYDPYAQHSWAAGLSPFADGNNQESSSEAMNAWNGVALWGDVTGNSSLSDSGRWMLANETATAQKAWRTVDTSPPYLAGYTAPVASLNFGGKRTYSTFFSNEPSTKLGIQLIPMNPSMIGLAPGDKSIEATIQNDNYNVPLGDYILMYLSLSQPKKAEQLLSKQQESFIDDGNSSSYLSAWIFAQSDK